MSSRRFYFWQRWLLHSFLIWLLTHASSFISFLYKRSIWGNYLLHEDGTPITAWEQIMRSLSNPETAYLILAGILLIEINRACFFNRNIWVFTGSSLLCGLSIAILLYLNNLFLHHSTISVSPETVFIPALYAFVYPLLTEFINSRIFKTKRLYEKSRAELIALKAQVNPHFFFNTLNGLYGTALGEKAKNTAAGIEKLSGMLRYVLTEGSADLVPVKSEIKFLEEYIQLQQLRIPGNKIPVKIHIRYDEQHAVIAPLLIIPLVENAFQYGISMENESFIILDLLIENGKLKLYLKNSIAAPGNKGTGTGVENVQRRLAMLYPGRHTLEIDQTANEYTVMLKINL